jgi:hypothetical protein
MYTSSLTSSFIGNQQCPSKGGSRAEFQLPNSKTNCQLPTNRINCHPRDIKSTARPRARLSSGLYSCRLVRNQNTVNNQHKGCGYAHKQQQAREGLRTERVAHGYIVT